MNVLFTIGFIAAVAMWTLAVYRRLVRLRTSVTQAWKLLQADQAKVAAQHVYNTHVDQYNAALESFPASLIAPLTGLKPARRFAPAPNPQSAI